MSVTRRIGYLHGWIIVEWKFSWTSFDEDCRQAAMEQEQRNGKVWKGIGRGKWLIADNYSLFCSWEPCWLFLSCLLYLLLSTALCMLWYMLPCRLLDCVLLKSYFFYFIEIKNGAALRRLFLCLLCSLKERKKWFL